LIATLLHRAEHTAKSVYLLAFPSQAHMSRCPPKHPRLRFPHSTAGAPILTARSTLKEYDFSFCDSAALGHIKFQPLQSMRAACCRRVQRVTRAISLCDDPWTPGPQQERPDYTNLPAPVVVDPFSPSTGIYEPNSFDSPAEKWVPGQTWHQQNQLP